MGRGLTGSWWPVACAVHTEVNNNALTLPDYFTGRFEDKSRVLRIISARGYSAVSLPSIALQELSRGRVCLKAPSA
ncbi:hypothetical protein LNP74_24810 [Klebsiella pneumoniae subsp. pneumoniae]|nr:hypothetical protein [Klebsiella pneumoniae subsp. pneumoniae]